MNKWILIRDLAIVFLLLAGMVALWQVFKERGSDWAPIRHVRIEGVFQYLTRDELKQALQQPVSKGFYHADLDSIKQAVQALPWADQVSVERVWPDAIKIRVTEQQPVARWQNNALLNNRGELFKPDNVAEFAALPLITGPEGQQQALLEIMKGLRFSLADKGMILQEFHVDNRRAWKIRLVSGMEIKLGRQTQLENMQRFLKTVDVVGEELIALMAIVDLRYPNGYAVTWKSPEWKSIIEKKKRA